MTRLGWAAAGALVTAALALGSVGLIIARRLTAPVSPRTYDLTIRSIDRSGDRPIVLLDRTSQTAATGEYSLLLESGGLVQLSGEVGDHGPELIGRTVALEEGQKLEAGMRVSWSGINFLNPHNAALEATEVSVLTPEGPAPAWLVPGQDGASSTWSVHIHGMGSPRAGTLRGVQVAAESGFTSLVVSYRNDGEGPFVGSGRSALGAAEMEDVREAIHFAMENGALQVVLFGWSMGGAIALQLANEPGYRGIVVGVVLDSPVLDWVSTIKANCARAGLPRWAGLLAVPWLSFRTWSRRAGLRIPIDLHRFDWIARASEMTVPVLILHGRGDTSSPFDCSARLGALRPDLVDLEAFDAEHTMSWNSNRERWRTSVSTWLKPRTTNSG